jgi:PBP1b-binding outer membrane lipoprotein LpoB
MKAAIALLALSLLLVAGCAVQESVEGDQQQPAEEVTADAAAEETGPMLIDDEEELEIGEML